MALRYAAIFAAFFLILLPRAGAAQDVTLTSHDGAVEIIGTLLGFDGEFYRVKTEFGELTIDGSGVLCDGPGCPNLSHYVAEIVFSGSSTMAEVLLPSLIEGFALRNGLLTERAELGKSRFEYILISSQSGLRVGRFVFHVSNSDEGFAELLSNDADVVMALREITPTERLAAFKAGMGDMTDHSRSRVLALDAMVPVVAPDNPVRRISTPQLAQVFTGQITNWNELGGPDAPISLHLPDLGSGMAQAAKVRLLQSTNLQLAENIHRYDRSSALARAVVVDPFAIGLASFAESELARALTLTGACDFSLSASRRTIKTEDYPLTSPMFLYLPARRLPKLGREFLRYIQSPAAQFVVRRSGFVDQAPEEISMNAQGDRFANAIQSAGAEVPLEQLQEMIQVLKPMARLSTTFRFESGSIRPDAQSRENIVQLARALEAGTYDARQLLFVGFSDGEGPAAGNQRIALKRANTVRDAVLNSAETANIERVDIQVSAFGEALPMACDDSEWGRQVNRRVEVWVR